MSGGVSPTLLQLVGEVHPSERGDVGEVALALPAEQVAVQGPRVQDPAVVRRVHGPEVSVWGAAERDPEWGAGRDSER